MRRDETIRILRDGRAVWEPYGVSRLRLFGSVARDTARADSDVDLLVEFSQFRDLFAPTLPTVQTARPPRKVLAEAVHVA